MNEKRGFIKTYRSILENPVINKDNDHFKLWMYLLLMATHTDLDILWNGRPATLKRGQLLTGRQQLSVNNGIQETKVERILKLFENAQQIEQQTTNKNRIITVLNYDKYQSSEQQNEQTVNNKRTTSEQQVNTNKELKEHKELNKQKKKDTVGQPDPIPYQVILDYLNEKSKKSYRPSSEKNKKFVKARWNEGYRLDDFKKVIDTKVKDWLNDPKMDAYLRPETLFSNKFEGYLNQNGNGKMSIKEKQEQTKSTIGIDI